MTTLCGFASLGLCLYSLWLLAGWLPMLTFRQRVGMGMLTVVGGWCAALLLSGIVTEPVELVLLGVQAVGWKVLLPGYLRGV